MLRLASKFTKSNTKLLNTAPQNGYESWYTVRTHEIDGRKRLTIPSLMMLMQEASMHNALQLQISIWDEGMDNLSWVILRKEITVLKLPTLGDKIKVVTYPAGFQRIFAYRDFWVYDEEGQEIAHAASTWTLINLKTRRVNRIPPNILSLGIPEAGELLPTPQVKLTLPDSYNTIYKYKIRHYDLDWNNHVNNIVFSKLMLQALPQELFESSVLKSFTIHIKAECYLEEEVSMDLNKDDNSYYHQMTGEDGRVVASGISKWS